MKTAVPGTRIGSWATVAATNCSRGRARAVSRSATRRRPVFHVVIIVKSTVPMTSGSHPPWATFNRFAPRNARSIDRNTPVTSSAAPSGHFQRSVAITCSSTAVITIVSVTAMP